MTLPMTLPDGGYLRLSFEGEVGVSGAGVTQRWDLTAFPEYIRADPNFKASLVVLARPSGSGITAMSPDVAFEPAAGVPETLVLSLDAAAVTDELSLIVWFLHSAIGAVGPKAQLYFVPIAGSAPAAASVIYPNAAALDTTDNGTLLTANTLYYLNADTGDFEVLLPAAPDVGTPILLVVLDPYRRVKLTTQGGDFIFGDAIAGVEAWLAASGDSFGTIFQLTYTDFLGTPVWQLDSSVRRSFTYKRQAQVVSTEPLPAFTASGPSGEPTETLTADANGALVVDGVTVNLGSDGLVIAGEAGADRQYHGVWDVQQSGTGAQPWILRRRLDFAFDGSTADGAKVPVIQGRYAGLEITFPFTADPGDAVDWIFPVDRYKTLGLTAVSTGLATRTVPTGEAIGVSGDIAARVPASNTVTKFHVDGIAINIAGTLTITITVTTVADSTAGDTSASFSDAGGGVLQLDLDNAGLDSTEWSVELEFLPV